MHAAAGNRERRLSLHAGFAQCLTRTTTSDRRDQPPMIQSQSQSATGEAGIAEKARRRRTGLLAGYQRTAGAFDELLAEDGELRPHYAKLIGALEEFSPAELAAALRTPASGSSTSRASPTMSMATRAAWNARGSWTRFRSSSRRTNGGRSKPGLIQRATLLNQHPRRLLRRAGTHPLALAFAGAGFRASRIFCVRATASACRSDIFLHFYAADLARSPDGRWWVVSDRTQIPTGAGYALANRLVTSRILPEPFRDNHVHRLAGFFPRRAKHARAAGAAPAGQAAGRHAHARPAQRNVFRAGVSGALPRLHAGRGPGPDRARQPRFSENPERPGARWT